MAEILKDKEYAENLAIALAVNPDFFIQAHERAETDSIVLKLLRKQMDDALSEIGINSESRNAVMLGVKTFQVIALNDIPEELKTPHGFVDSIKDLFIIRSNKEQIVDFLEVAGKDLEHEAPALSNAVEMFAYYSGDTIARNRQRIREGASAMNTIFSQAVEADILRRFEDEFNI